MKKYENKTTKQIRATILVKKPSLVEATRDASVVWVWPEDCPLVTVVTGPDGHIQESDFVLTAVRCLVEDPICFLGQSLRLPCGDRGQEQRLEEGQMVAVVLGKN